MCHSSIASIISTIISVQWMHYIVLNLFFHQIHSSQGSPVFMDNKNVMKSFHTQFGRNIKQSPCFIHKTGANGICMFSIDCVKANGTHLGTCNDRFYIGLCCKLKNGSDMIEAEIVENIIDQKITILTTESDMSTHKTTSKRYFATQNPIRSTSAKRPTSIELQTSESIQREIVATDSSIVPMTSIFNANNLAKRSTISTASTHIVMKENSTDKIQTIADSTIQNLPEWILISNILSLSSSSQQKDSIVTIKPNLISFSRTVTHPMINPWYTRFPTRKPEYTLATDRTTMTSTTANETVNLSTEETNIIDRPDETITATDNNEFTPATGYQSGLIESTTSYDSSTEYRMDLTTASANENNENPIFSSTDEAMLPILVTNTFPPNSFESAFSESTLSILDSRTEPVFSTIEHSQISSSNSGTYEIGGSTTSKFVEVSTIEEIPASTNGLQIANYKQGIWLVDGLYAQSRIVGGAKASFGRWPWQISLKQWQTSSFVHICGAALLNENWAITAAHCIENVYPADLLLRLGEFDLAIDEEPFPYQERRVQMIISHPQFDSVTLKYDLALMRLHGPVVFRPNIMPVCLPETDDNFIGNKAYVTGWGKLYEDGPLPSELQEVPVPILNNTSCEGMYRNAGYRENIPSHLFICAGHMKGGRDSCAGDSCGPLVIEREDKRFLLAGVISWGINCAEPNQPGVYTRISEFRSWINQILQF